MIPFAPNPALAGYVITLAGCAILWVCKLQTTIALSTMQAEYQALFTS
jgi:hypothetical protein